MAFAISLPDWNSLDSVRRAHSELEAVALVFFALLVLFDVLAHLSKDEKGKTLLEKIALAFFAVAVLAEIAAYPYGQRNDFLSAQVIGSLDVKSKEASTNASSALTKSGAAETKANEAETKSREALTRARAAERSLAKAEADAGKAQTAAANALTTAIDASARAAKAEASLGKAETEAKNAESSALNALTLAREARKEAASFESDLARLKQQAADRILSEYQQDQVKQRVELFILTPYELAVADTPEAEKLLTEIDAALGSAGWLYRASDSTSFRFTKKLHNGHVVEQISGFKGVQIGLTSALMAKFKPAATALAKVLNFEGISAFVVKLPDDDPSPNNIHIMVGSKP